MVHRKHERPAQHRKEYDGPCRLSIHSQWVPGVIHKSYRFVAMFVMVSYPQRGLPLITYKFDFARAKFVEEGIL